MKWLELTRKKWMQGQTNKMTLIWKEQSSWTIWVIQSDLTESEQEQIRAIQRFFPWEHFQKDMRLQHVWGWRIRITKGDQISELHIWCHHVTAEMRFSKEPWLSPSTQFPWQIWRIYQSCGRYQVSQANRLDWSLAYQNRTEGELKPCMAEDTHWMLWIQMLNSSTSVHWEGKGHLQLHACWLQFRRVASLHPCMLGTSSHSSIQIAPSVWHNTNNMERQCVEVDTIQTWALTGTSSKCLQQPGQNINHLMNWWLAGHTIGQKVWVWATKLLWDEAEFLLIEADGCNFGEYLKWER